MPVDTGPPTTHTHAVKIAEAIRSLLPAGKSQTEIAAEMTALGREIVDQSKVSGWARGGRTPNLDQLALIEDWAQVKRGTILASAGYLDPDVRSVPDATVKRLDGIEEALDEMTAVMRELLDLVKQGAGTRTPPAPRPARPSRSASTSAQ